MKPHLLPALFFAASSVFAHPMGNFSINHYARIDLGPHGTRVRYVLDLAEIPTFEMLQKWGLDATAPRAELLAKAESQAREWSANLVFTNDGRDLQARFEKADLVIDNGAGGMPVIRIGAALRLPATPGRLEYEDRNYVERAGWKEIVIVGAPGVEIRHATESDQDRSQALTAYPQDPTVAPPQVLRASVEWSVAPPVISENPTPRIIPVQAAAPVPPQAEAPGTVVRGDFLSQMLHRGDIPWTLTLLGVAVAFGLGAMHALSPGHGKTIVAAYLVGTHGTFKHAIFLGGMVTFTHTISVFALGLTTLFLSRYVLPEKIFPILGAISGLSIVWIGLMLLVQRARRLSGHRHVHDHHHDHSHDHDHLHDHDHVHGPGGHTHVPEGEVTMASLIALGASGGLVPCPSALVLLLSSVALGRVALGLVLLIGFSLGLAAVLMAIGMAVLYAKNLIPDSRKAAASPAFRVIPVLSAAVIVCLGLLMTGVSLGVIRPSRFIG
jgi:ABC-type nickel/cobalt efflux system permease component RcnA